MIKGFKDMLRRRNIAISAGLLLFLSYNHLHL
jgi:hypothetical protein